MAMLKVGTRLKSTVCNTEVMVIAAPGDDLDIKCGGATMLAPADATTDSAGIDADHANGAQMGKRYCNESGDLELLCVKPGDGSLAVGSVALQLKEAKVLPSSD